MIEDSSGSSLGSVGGNARRHDPTETKGSVSVTELGADRPNGKESLHMEACAPIMGLELQGAPIKLVNGHPWSPGVCQLLLLGKTLEVAWVRAFVPTSHF